ncbi:MAG TPA: PQQ-binding-like beta-propeller repeat protein [Gemmataceae bacterium]|nr:PQQ-binding-like beta-propeller repeat protein [Gemmataceae bacterium]
MMTRFFWAVLTALFAAAAALAGDWPGWRGPTGMGYSEEKDLPLTWGGKDGENILWKQRLPGADGKARLDNNQSSPIVQGGRVFVTVSYWPAGVDAKEYPEHHVACYKADDGTALWDVTVEPGPWKLSDLRGGYTAPTPAADADRVYVVFGSSVIAALDHDGKPVWRKEITPYDFDVAVGCSPVLYGDVVLLQCDQNEKHSRLLAFDRKTGDLKWEKARPEHGFAHGTPTLADVKGKTELLVAASGALQGLDPNDGSVLWTCQAAGDTVSPVYANSVAYIDSGRGGPGFAVDPTGMGDVSKTHLKWKLDVVPEGFGSPIAAAGLLYRLLNSGYLSCRRLDDGGEVYSKQLSGVTGPCSPVLTVDGRIYCASAGKSFVLRAGPKPDILAVNDLGDASQASPAVADGRLYLKGRQYLYCIGKK